MCILVSSFRCSNKCFPCQLVSREKQNGPHDGGSHSSDGFCVDKTPKREISNLHLLTTLDSRSNFRHSCHFPSSSSFHWLLWVTTVCHDSMINMVERATIIVKLWNIRARRLAAAEAQFSKTVKMERFEWNIGGQRKLWNVRFLEPSTSLVCARREQSSETWNRFACD